MIDFVKIYEEKIRTIKDRIAFTDGTEAMTYGHLDEAASKIHSYLKRQGIGKENFVQILLPRGVKIPASVIGVVKSGAAFSLLEDTYPADRIEFIYKDCNCRLRIDEDLFDEIMQNEEPLWSFEDMDPHDACYAVYTSGSTGNPKGVLHEYGNIEQNYKSFETWYDDDIENSAIFAPFYFVAGVIDIFHYITRGRTTYLIPHDMTRDFAAVKKFISDNNIQELFLPPSYLQIYTNPSKTLKVIYTGSEPANGLTYNNDPTLINFYAMSESGFVVLQTDLNKKYEIAPVGKPLLDEIQLCLIDEDGKVVEGEGQGEICFTNKYVRGYINLVDQTKKTWRDGIYHTNDCARRDKEGNYYVIGRYDDMIKINGNRVEPVEIEARIKELTGLERVIAKGFKINNRSFICAYFLKDEAMSLGLYKDGLPAIDTQALKSMLPDYMIPTYYVGLESFPLLPNGKIAKKNLLPPSIDDMKPEYTAPETELEKKLCELFAQVLKLKRVGATDDFFITGGDSMSMVILVSKCAEAGINIDAKSISDHRTPRLLAAYYEKNKDACSRKTRVYDNSNALKVPNRSGLAFLGATKKGEGGLFKYHLTSPVNDTAINKAYENVIERYPFYSLSYEIQNGILYYKEPDNIPRVLPFSCFEKKDPVGEPLIRVYYQDETLIIYYYHILTDGEGVFFFASTLLHEYINISNDIHEEITVRQFDHSYDVLEKKIPVEGEYLMYPLPETYFPPEYDPDNIELTSFKIRLKRSDWLAFVNAFISETGLTGLHRLQGIGGTDAFMAGYLFIKAFAEVHPDADKPLMCRFPVNMRYSLDRENTLRNCALPQAFYNTSAKSLLASDMAMVDAFERISAQLSADNVSKEVNRLVDFIDDPDSDIGKDPVYKYMTTATVLATNLGNIASAEDAMYIKDFSIDFKPTCYTGIQACIKGDEQILIINQRFKDDIYVRQIITDLESSDTIKVYADNIIDDDPGNIICTGSVKHRKDKNDQDSKR